MKALTVRHPWAWAIIEGGKNVENRGRRTNFRGRILIHAGKEMDFDAFTFPALQDAEDRYVSRGVSVFGDINRIDLSTCGMALGVVDLVGCHHSRECGEGEGMCSEWAMEDSWHWELENPQAFASPFEAKGKLGFWECNGPNDPKGD